MISARDYHFLISIPYTSRNNQLPPNCYHQVGKFEYHLYPYLTSHNIITITLPSLKKGNSYKCGITSPKQTYAIQLSITKMNFNYIYL
jgi:hypothetical protein